MNNKDSKAWDLVVLAAKFDANIGVLYATGEILAADAELTRLREIVDEAILVIEMRRSNFSDGLPLAKLWELTRAELRRRAKEG